MKPTVYIETSVISYLTAAPSRDIVVAAHQQTTREWWAEALPQFEAYISPFVLEEITKGDQTLANKRTDAVNSFFILGITPEIDALAMRYFSAINIPEKARIDAYHLALAVGHGIDYLLSWNCKHIASARVRKVVGEINDILQVKSPIICTPEELMEI